MKRAHEEKARTHSRLVTWTIALALAAQALEAVNAAVALTRAFG
jgi:hypothetical protein